MKLKINLKISFIICLLFLGGFIFVYLLNDNPLKKTEAKIEKIKIAACPTCYEMAKRLDPQKYQVIPTPSTAASLELLENNQADMVFAGRTLKSWEPIMDEVIIKDGYSFIGTEEQTVYIDKLNNFKIFTDLEVEPIKLAFRLESVQKVENVYDYLNQGLIITSWENTDYSKSEIVHVLEKNGERTELSRRPTIYCPQNCGEEAREIALLLK